MKDSLYSQKQFVPFNNSEQFKAPTEKCSLCRKNINAHCSVHRPECPYSCETNQIPVGDILPLFIFTTIYLLIKQFKR